MHHCPPGPRCWRPCSNSGPLFTKRRRFPWKKPWAVSWYTTSFPRCPSPWCGFRHGWGGCLLRTISERPAGYLQLEAGGGFLPADTGDDFDDRFDAVIPIEQAELSPEGRLTLRWEGPLEPGQNIRPRGSTIRAGELLARKERQLRPFDLACLAMGGITHVEVYQAPRVASCLPAASWYRWASQWRGARISTATAFWCKGC